jgi:archaellum biogenesis protein FlaJ (TadC family)
MSIIIIIIYLILSPLLAQPERGRESTTSLGYSGQMQKVSAGSAFICNTKEMLF